MKSNTFRLVHLFSLMFLVVSFAAAQSNIGSIEGTVVDQNGAVIPNAKIKATFRGANSENVSTTTTSNNEGFFRFSSMPFGTYDLDLRLHGLRLPSKRVLKLTQTKNFEQI